jgi:hypothetical protein
MHRSALVAVVAATLSTGAAFTISAALHAAGGGSAMVAETVREVSEQVQAPAVLRSSRRPIGATGRPVIIKVSGQVKESKELQPKHAP